MWVLDVSVSMGVVTGVGVMANLEWVFSTMVGCIQDLAEARGSSLSVVTGPRSCGRPSPSPNIPGGVALTATSLPPHAALRPLWPAWHCCHWGPARA